MTQGGRVDEDDKLMILLSAPESAISLSSSVIQIVTHSNCESEYVGLSEGF